MTDSDGLCRNTLSSQNSDVTAHNSDDTSQKCDVTAAAGVDDLSMAESTVEKNFEFLEVEYDDTGFNLLDSSRESLYIDEEETAARIDAGVLMRNKPKKSASNNIDEIILLSSNNVNKTQTVTRDDKSRKSSSNNIDEIIVLGSNKVNKTQNVKLDEKSKKSSSNNIDEIIVLSSNKISNTQNMTLDDNHNLTSVESKNTRSTDIGGTKRPGVNVPKCKLQDTAIQTSLEVEGYVGEISKHLQREDRGISKPIEHTKPLHEERNATQSFGTVDDALERFIAKYKTRLASGTETKSTEAVDKPTNEQVKLMPRSRSVKSKKENQMEKFRLAEDTSLSGSLRELSHLNIDVSHKLVVGEQSESVSEDLQVMVNALTPVLNRRRSKGRGSRRKDLCESNPRDTDSIITDQYSNLSQREEDRARDLNQTQVTTTTIENVGSINPGVSKESQPRRAELEDSGVERLPHREERLPVREEMMTVREERLSERLPERLPITEERLPVKGERSKEERLPLFTRLKSYDGSLRRRKPSVKHNPVSSGTFPRRKNLLYQPPSTNQPIATLNYTHHENRPEPDEVLRHLNRVADPLVAPHLNLMTDPLASDPLVVPDREGPSDDMFINPQHYNTWHGVSRSKKPPVRAAPRMGVGVLSREHGKSYTSPYGTTRREKHAKQPRNSATALPVISRTLLDALHKRYCAHQYAQHYR